MQHGEAPAAASHAITVAPTDYGWRWELIDAEGALTANGVAADQEDALKSAWLAARSRSTPASGESRKPGLVPRGNAVGPRAA